MHQRGREGNGGKDFGRGDEAQKSRHLQNLRRDHPLGPHGDRWPHEGGPTSTSLPSHRGPNISIVGQIWNQLL